MRILIAGASGLIGTQLRNSLLSRGDQVTLLVRRKPLSANEVEWNPSNGSISANLPSSFDAVVNLSGASIGKLPWTKSYQRKLVSSRVEATSTLVNAIASGTIKTEVLVSASGSGFYGDTGNILTDESSPKGSGFLADLAATWEDEALKAEAHTRVVLLRTGVVLAPSGGALAKLIPLIRLGVGGPLGSGKQWWPWITLTDEVRAILFLIDRRSAEGAFNLASPQRATCGEIVKALGTALKKPTFLAVPEFALRTLLGVAAEEVLLSSTPMEPKRLTALGFSFSHSSLEAAVRYVLKK